MKYTWCCPVMSTRQMYAWHKHYTPNMGVSTEIILTKYVLYTLYYPIYNEYIWCICQYHIYHIVLFHIKHGIICLSVSIPQLWRQVWYFVFFYSFSTFLKHFKKRYHRTKLKHWGQVMNCSCAVCNLFCKNNSP